MNKDAFKKTLQGRELCELRDLIMSAPESSDRTRALELLTRIFNGSYGFWLLAFYEREDDESNNPT